MAEETAPAAPADAVELLNLETGAVELRPAGEVTQLVGAGGYALKKGRVEVLDQFGRRGTIDATDAPDAFTNRGYRFFTASELEEERKEETYGDRELAAGAAGLARGATLGLSDLLLTSTGAVEAETLRELGERNKTASVIGEVAGSALPALFSGGASLPAGAATRLALRGATRMGGSVARRMATQGALEGAMFGLGQTISETSLGKAELTAEKITADVGLGLVFGGVAGGVFGKLQRAEKGLAPLPAPSSPTRGMMDGGGVLDDLAARASAARAADDEARAAARAATPEPVPDVPTGPRQRGPDGRYLSREEAAKVASEAAPPAGAAGAGDDAARAAGAPPAAGGGGGGGFTREDALATAGRGPDDLPMRGSTDGPTERSGFGGFDDEGDGRTVYSSVTPARAPAAPPPAPVPRPAPDAPPAPSVADDVRAPGAGVADDVPPPAGNPGAPPPPPGAPPPAGGAPDGASGPWDDDPMGAFDDLLSDGELGAKTRKQLEEGVKKHGGRVKKLLEDLGLEWPTPENWVLRDLDIQREATQRLRQKGREVSAPRALLQDSRYEAATSLEQKLALIRAKQQEAGQQIGEAVKRFDALAHPEDMVNPRELAARARKEIVAPLTKGPELAQPIAEKIAKELDRLEALGDRITFEQAEEIKRGFDPFISWDSAEPKPVQQALRKLRGMINGEIESKVGAIQQRAGAGAELLDPWRKAKRLYGDMASLAPMTEKRLSARQANRFISLTDNMAGLAGFMAGGGPNPVGLAMGAAGAVLNKWGRERLPHLMALQMHRLETSGGSAAAARAFRDMVLKGTEGAAAAAGGAVDDAARAAAAPFGQWSDMLRRAAQLGEREAWALHTALSADPKYRDAMQQAGLDFRAEADAAGRQRVKGLSDLEQSARRTDERVASAVDGFLSGKRARVSATPPAKLLEDARKLVDLAQRPEAVQDALARATEAMGRIAPGTSVAMMQAAQRGLQFLAEKAPKAPPAALDVPALRKPFRPPDAELAKFSRYVAAVKDPVAVLDTMAAGTITREAVEALEAVYPSLLDDMRVKVSERLAAYPGRLDFRQRQTLGRMLNMPVDDLSTPQAVAFLQGLHQQGGGEEAGPRGGQDRRSGPVGTRAMRRLGSEASTSDRLLARAQA